MRIMTSSNSLYTKTGYGVQSRLMLPRIAALGHDVGMCAWYGLEGGMLNFSMEHQGKTYPIPLYPKGRDGYGNDVVGMHAQHFKADIVISLIDAWVLNAAAHSPGSIRYCPYFPVDMEPLPPPVLRVVKESFQPIVYSRFGETMARNAGLDPRYVPHMVECNVFCPGDKGDARKALGWPEAAFIVGMVAANKGTPSRKSYPEQLKAFADFSQRHPDALLYLHTNKGESDGMGGVNLPELIEQLGIQDRVLWPDAYGYMMGYPDGHLVNVYRGMDVLLSVSRGEGFGVPIVEAQSCGTPVIVGDWTAMGELCFGGWKVDKKDAHADYTPLAAYNWIPRPDAIRNKLESAYIADMPAFSALARAGALAYDADEVATQYWGPVLGEIQARLSGAVSLETFFSTRVKVAA